jgi:hypothetical protein
MRQVAIFLPTILILLALFAPGFAWAQSTPAEMALFPIPPSKGYTFTKDFQFVGDSVGHLATNYAVYPADIGAATYAYYRMTNLAGKNISIWPRVETAIPPPKVLSDGRLADACGHTHLSYGVWVRYDLIFAGARLTGVPFVGGGGMSGVRHPQGKCELKVQNDLVQISPAFGWGSDFTAFNVLPHQTFIKELIVGASVPTHGWGTCLPSGGFTACFEPVRMNVWTLAPNNISPVLNFSRSIFSPTKEHTFPGFGVESVTAQSAFAPTCPLADIMLEMLDGAGLAVSQHRLGGPPAKLGNASAVILSQNMATSDTTVQVQWSSGFLGTSTARYRIRYTGLGLGCP